MAPNVLLICTDQHRFDVISTYPGSVAQTPHLQELANDGVVFDACYSPSPICSPSRASLLTGQYPSRHGLWANGVTLPDDSDLVSAQLADHGYRCGLVGKMHLAPAFQGITEQRLNDGFEVFRWAHDPFHGSPENAYHHWLQQKFPDLWASAAGEAFTADVKNFTHADTAFDAMPTEAHYSTWVTEEVESFLESAQDDRPFFLMANFYDPHHPFVAPPEYVDRYPIGSVPGPVGGPQELEGKPAFQTDASGSSYNGHGPSYTDFDAAGIDQIRRTYYAMVSLVDDCAGRILDMLDARGLTENTLVIFTSDHGEMLGDHAMLLKGAMMYDPAVRVPMIARWPGSIPAGGRVAGFVGVHDIARTIRVATGLPASPRDQGVDLVAVARGDLPPRTFALCQYRDSGYAYEPQVFTTMFRSGPHKIIVWHGDPATHRERTGELYDLETDPHELTNHWDDETWAPVKARLLAEMVDAMVSLEDRTAPRTHPW